MIGLVVEEAIGVLFLAVLFLAVLFLAVLFVDVSVVGGSVAVGFVGFLSVVCSLVTAVAVLVVLLVTVSVLLSALCAVSGEVASLAAAVTVVLVGSALVSWCGCAIVLPSAVVAKSALATLVVAAVVLVVVVVVLGRAFVGVGVENYLSRSTVLGALKPGASRVGVSLDVILQVLHALVEICLIGLQVLAEDLVVVGENSQKMVCLLFLLQCLAGVCQSLFEVIEEIHIPL